MVSPTKLSTTITARTVSTLIAAIMLTTYASQGLKTMILSSLGQSQAIPSGDGSLISPIGARKWPPVVPRVPGRRHTRLRELTLPQLCPVRNSDMGQATVLRFEDPSACANDNPAFD